MTEKELKSLRSMDYNTNGYEKKQCNYIQKKKGKINSNIIPYENHLESY